MTDPVPTQNRLVTQFRPYSFLRFRDLTLYTKSKLARFGLRPEHAMETVQQVYDMIWPWFVDRLLSTGLMLQLDSNRRMYRGLLGTNFIPEQMTFIWDGDMEGFVQGEGIIYIHMHDESHLPYVEGFGALDGHLKHQLFPTDYDLDFAQQIDDKSPTKSQCYNMGPIGCLRYWPSWELEFYETHLSKAKRDLFMARLKDYYQSKGLPLSPP